MPPKTLKIDLAAKPQSTPEDQYLILNLLGESFKLASINAQTFRNALQNVFLEAFSTDLSLSKQSPATLIPESPNQHSQASQQLQVQKIASPRSIMSPYFQSSTKSFEQEFHSVQRILPRVEPPKEYTSSTTLALPSYTQSDENDIISSISELYPEGLTIHTQHVHPALVKAQNLAKTLGRTQFEPDEELRVVNDILFEGVFGMPGFLGWTTLPMILAWYGKIYTVGEIADYLLTHGDVIYYFLYSTNQKFVLTPQILRKWYAEMFENKPLSVRFFNALRRPDHDYLDIYDIYRVCFVLLKLHPGLAFLQETPNFYQLYAQTVSYRVVFEADVNFKGYLTARDLKKTQTDTGTYFSPDLLIYDCAGGLLESFWQSQFEQDINKNLKCFSYEHFYVFYVSFWELDLDHDKALTLYDLERYQQNTLSKPVCKRAFEALIDIRKKMPEIYRAAYQEINKNAPSRGELEAFVAQQKLYYPDFVRFLIYTENPDLDVSVQFFMQILDLDGDGAINFSDFSYFFKFQQDKMEANGVDLLDCKDVFCQMLDFYKCNGKIATRDIMRSQSRANLFSVMAHYQRMQQFDQKDPYTMKNYLVPEKTMWEKFCRRQYDLQVYGVQGDGF